MAKQFTVTIQTSNAAFDPEAGGNPLAEVARILDGISEELTGENATRVNLFDINGDHVGVAQFSYDIYGEED